MGAKPYKSAAGITLYAVDSLRAKNMPDELDDILIAKMREIDPVGFSVAYLMNDGNYLVGCCARAYTAMKVREKTNKNDGVIVEMTQKVGGGKKGWAWCMYEMQACVGISETLTGVKSDFPWTGSCDDARKRMPKHLIIGFQNSIFGAVWIGDYPEGGGHTGAFDHWKVKNKIAVLNEGNTTSGKAGDKVVAEGGGSYQTERELTKFWAMCALAFPLQANAPEKDVTPVPVSEFPVYGEISDRVGAMQTALNRYGASLKVDNHFWRLTKEALSKFQKSHGLSGTGIPGPKTMALLSGAQGLPVEVVGTPENPNWDALWKTCVVDSDRAAEIAAIKKKMDINRSTYEKIAKLADTEWWVVALTHYRENSALIMDVYLHNGQKLGQTTTIVPKGIFFRKDQFIEASVDAMGDFRGCHTPGDFCGRAERFNGLGYRKKKGDRGVTEYSPYVTAGTNHHDETSKYVADGKYDPKAKEKQLGVMAILKGLLS